MGLEPLCDALLEKVREQVERTTHLIRLTPADRLGWKPPYPGAWPVEALLGHILDCLAGFCAVLSAVEPERLRHFTALRSLPVNHASPPDEALETIGVLRAHIEEGFALLTDSGLGESIPTVFTPNGEPVLTLLLGNLEHLINHKHQLFTYLKEMGVEVGTGDLYRFRGD